MGWTLPFVCTARQTGESLLNDSCDLILLQFIIVSMGMQNALEMPFAKGHDMTEAFPPGRADETFAATVLPG